MLQSPLFVELHKYPRQSQSFWMALQHIHNIETDETTGVTVITTMIAGNDSIIEQKIAVAESAADVEMKMKRVVVQLARASYEFHKKIEEEVQQPWRNDDGKDDDDFLQGFHIHA